MARKWLAELPQRALNLILGKNLGQGVKMIVLENDIIRPSFKVCWQTFLTSAFRQEISEHYVWLRAVVEESPQKAPELLSNGFP